jgi:hypothetical protein
MTHFKSVTKGLYGFPAVYGNVLLPDQPVTWLPLHNTNKTELLITVFPSP